MATKTAVQIKAEIFDILRSQQTLQIEVNALEQQKNEKLKELAAAEAAEAKADTKAE
jgi:hypothetical protein